MQIVVIGACVALSCYVLWPEPSLVNKSMTALDSVLEGDPTYIIRNMRPEEKVSLSMSDAQLTSFLKDYVLPKFKGWKPGPILNQETEKYGLSGWTTIQLEHTSGLKAPFTVSFSDATDQPFVSLRSILGKAFELDYRLAHPEDEVVFPEINIWAVKRDFAKLKKYGLTFTNQTGGPPLSIEAYLERADVMLADAKMVRGKKLIREGGNWKLVPKDYVSKEVFRPPTR